MLVNEILSSLTEAAIGEEMPDLAPVKSVFEKFGVTYFQPKVELVSDLANRHNYPGIYFIVCPDLTTGNLVYFYIGISGSNISQRFASHYAKMRGEVYKNMVERRKRVASSHGHNSDEIEEWNTVFHANEFPDEWRLHVAQQIFGLADPLPRPLDILTRIIPNTKETYVSRTGAIKTRYRVILNTVNLPALQMKRDPSSFNAFVWNLKDKATISQIEKIEGALIQLYQPLCNASGDRNPRNIDKVPEELRELIGKIESQPIAQDLVATKSEPREVTVVVDTKQADKPTDAKVKTKTNPTKQEPQSQLPPTLKRQPEEVSGILEKYRSIINNFVKTLPDNDEREDFRIDLEDALFAGGTVEQVINSWKQSFSQ